MTNRATAGDAPTRRRRRRRRRHRLSLLTLLPGFLVSKVVLVLFLRATRLCGRTFALQLSFFLSTVSRTLNYTAWIRLDIYLPCAKKRFWRIIIVDFGFGERALGERERFFFFVSLCCSATKHCLKKEPPSEISLSLSLSHLHLHLFISFFQKLRFEREDTHTKKRPH